MTREEAIERFNGIINAMSISIAQSKFYPSKAELDELCGVAIEALSEPNARLTHDLTHACVDLISRADAIEAVESLYYTDRKKVLEALKELPSADIVRCKDCDRGFGSPVCPIQSQGWAINTDTFFCAWGERRGPNK